MSDRLPLEDGWPSRAFDEEARAYLLDEARRRVQAQLSHLRAQDVKIAALFTASAGLFALSGFLGNLRVDAEPEVILTFMALFASLVAWLFLGVAYWTREIASGLNLEIIRDHYAGSSRQELENVSLESSIAAFAINQQTILTKAVWLQRSFVAVAAQLLLIFASVLVTASTGAP